MFTIETRTFLSLTLGTLYYSRTRASVELQHFRGVTKKVCLIQFNVKIVHCLVVRPPAEMHSRPHIPPKMVSEARKTPADGKIPTARELYLSGKVSGRKVVSRDLVLG